MARAKQDDDMLMEDELAAAFLDDDVAVSEAQSPSEENWDEDQAIPGQLAVDVYETKEHVVVKARTAGVNKEDLEVTLSDNTLTIRGTLSSGEEVEAEQYHIQECYWGEFSRTITLPVPVKEDEIEAVLKDGVLTITFTKVKQDTVKKIEVK